LLTTKHLRGLIVGLFLLLPLSSCRQSTKLQGKAAFSQSGWLVTKIRDGRWNAVAVGDGKHEWAWQPGKKGIWLVDSSGSIVNDKAPFLAEVVSGWGIIPLGDKRHGLAIVDNGLTSAPSNAYMVGLFPDDSSSVPLLPAGYDAIRTHETAEGIWIHCEKRQSDRLKGTVWVANDFYFLPSNSLKLEGPWKAEALGNNDERLVGSTLVTAGVGLDTNDFLRCFLITRKAGIVPIRLPNASALQAEGRDGMTQVIPAPGSAKFWLRSGLSSLYLVDTEIAIQNSLSKAEYTPLEISSPYQLTLRPLENTKAIGYPTPHWDGRTQWLNNLRGAFLIDGLKGSMTPIPSLDGQLIDNVVVLNKVELLVQVGATAEDQHLMYVPSNGDTRDIGKSVDLAVDLSPWEDPHQGGTTEVFPDENGHSFIIRATDFAFRLDVKGESPITVLARHDAKDVNRFVAPPLTSDSVTSGRLWLINYVEDAPGRGVVVWNRTQALMINSPPLFQHELELPAIIPFGNGRHALACRGRTGLSLIDMESSIPTPKLKLGTSELGADWIPESALGFAPNREPARVNFSPKALSGSLDSQATFEILISEQRTGRQRKWMTPALRADEENYSLAPSVAGQESNAKAQIPYGRACTVQATLSDPLGSKVTWTWGDVIFKEPEPLWARPSFRSVLVFLAICLFAWVCKRLRGSPQTVTRITLYIISIGSPWIGKDFLDSPVLISLLGISLLAGAVLGLLSPKMFRELESLDPFRPFAGLATSIPLVRKRLFASYLVRLRDRIDRERQKANNETYTPIPIKVKEGRKSRLDSSACSSADQICKLLTALRMEERVTVVIEAPGGRGKSALLRESVRLAVEKQSIDPRIPIPVFCDGEGATLFDRAKESLGRDGFSDDLLRGLAKSGAFFFIVDGLSESTVSPKILREHLAAFDNEVPLLLSSRPSNPHVQTVQQVADAWMVVEPERLNDSTLETFIKAYGKSRDALSMEVLQACRDDDGTYLPILIRLAILGGGTGMQSIRDVYAGAINQILTNKGFSVDSAVQFCLETYWETGERRLQFANAPQERKAILATLAGADLVVPAEMNPTDATNPHTVRFFHDSIQSYLTSVGIIGKPDWQDRLLLAAGDPRFDADATRITELFVMCLHTFQPQSTLRKHLLNSVQRFSVDFAGALSRDWVIEAAELALSNLISSDTAGGMALARAAEECFKQPDIRSLGFLYARAARYLWPKPRKQSDIAQHAKTRV